MDASTIVDEWSQMKSDRSCEEADWRALETYLSPEREEMRDGLDNPIVVDGTGYNALDNFASGLFGSLTNPANKWISFKTGDDDLNNFHTVKSYLESSTNIVLRSFGTETSSFYRSIGEFFMDEAQYGNAFMYSEVRPEKQRFLDVCRPLNEMYVKLDAEGELDVVCRHFKLTYRQARGEFGDGLTEHLQEDKSGVTTQHEFLHCVYPNPNRKAGRIGPEGMEWNSQYVLVEKRASIGGGIKGYYDMPYDFGRWSRRSGRGYGKGPGHKALPDLRMLSQMGVDLIDLANFIARPPILAADEESVSTAKMYPNATIYGGIDERTGRQLVDYLINQGNIPITLEMLRETRQMVKDTFLWSLMQMVGRTGMTATEVLEYQEERMRLMGPQMARQQTEVLSPAVVRRFRALEREGQLPPPPPELKNRLLQLQYESPMAKAQKTTEATATMRVIEGITRVAQIRQDVVDNLDADEIATVLQEGFGAPPRIILGREKVAESRAARQQMEQAGTALSAGDQMASIAQKVSQATSGQGGRPVGS